ncbi:hypothetical protein ACQJ6T_06640 [Helicobacter pylori]
MKSPKSALKNAELNQVKNVLTPQIHNGVYSFRGDAYRSEY